MPRVWTKEQRLAMSERMKAQIVAAKKREAEAAGLSVPEASVAVAEATVEKVRAPEVQAVLDSMTPERRAKLAMIQARTLATKEGQEALARHEAEKVAVLSPETSTVALPPSRLGSREVSLIVRTDGTLVSQYGPCVCGAAKRQWHKICLKEVSGRV